MSLRMSLYNRIAGQNRERLAALSDGVFAVAMTLLVLDLKAPAVEAIHAERELAPALAGLAPRRAATQVAAALEPACGLRHARARR